jgi:hypothetical protein
MTAMEARQILTVLSSILFAVASILYIKDILSEKFRPNIASFVVWSFTNTSLLVSLVVRHVWASIPFAFIQAATAVAVVILSMKQSRFYFSFADKACLVSGLLGLLVWGLTKDATYNVYIITTVNFIVFLPITIKSFKHPDLETVFPWRVNLMASVLLLISVPNLALLTLALPVQQVACSLPLNIGLWLGERSEADK